MNEFKEFLKEYATLCKKYKVYIDGCGCCNSPYLQKFGQYINEEYFEECEKEENNYGIYVDDGLFKEN